MVWFDWGFLIIVGIIFLAVSRNKKTTILSYLVAAAICMIFNLDISAVIFITFVAKSIIGTIQTQKEKRFI